MSISHRTEMLFLSIHPHFVEKIFAGVKTIELRRQRPRCLPGDLIAIYSTTPERCLKGVVQVKEVQSGGVKDMWDRVRHEAGVTRVQYDQYFTGSKKAVGIVLTAPVKLITPVSLHDLRRYWPDFQPPQSFRYLDQSQIEFVLSKIKRMKLVA